MVWIENQTFLDFVNFGENLCSKRFDTNDLKTRYLNSSKRKKIAMNQKQTFLVFVKFSEKLCSKRFDTNDIKTRYLNSSKRKKFAMNRKSNFVSVCTIC